jgi:hypothetical protein
MFILFRGHIKVYVLTRKLNFEMEVETNTVNCKGYTNCKKL